jgi:hypothetical protein
MLLTSRFVTDWFGSPFDEDNAWGGPTPFGHVMPCVLPGEVGRPEPDEGNEQNRIRSRGERCYDNKRRKQIVANECKHLDDGSRSSRVSEGEISIAPVMDASRENSGPSSLGL